MSEFECKICRLSVNSQEQLSQHLSGKAHRKKMKALGYLEAETGLDAPIDPPPAMQADPLNLQQSESQSINTAAPRKRKSSDDFEPGVCPLCNVIFNSVQQREAHFNGSKHIKKKKLITGELKTETKSQSGLLHCGYCKIQVNSPEQMEIHKHGKKHRENFEKVNTYPVSHSQTNPDPAVEDTSNTDPDDFPGSWKNKYKPKTTEINTHFDKAGMLYCGFCNIQVNSMEQLEIHRRGSKHKKKFEKIKASPVTYPSMKPTEKKPIDAPTGLPPFESYLTTFVMSSTTESTVQSSQGLN